jgi:CRP/FNR family transcriptional regulator
VIDQQIKTYLAFVKKICPLIPDDDLLMLGTKLSVQQFKKNDLFITTGEIQKSLGFIISGLVRSYYIDSNAEEHTMRFMSDMEFVTDYPALLSYEPTKYNFHCLANTTMVILPHDAIKEAYNAPQFNRFGRIIAEKVLQVYHARVESFLFESAEQRYMNFVKSQPGLFKHVSVTHLCSYLGVKRQTLTRIRKKIIKPGLLI